MNILKHTNNSTYVSRAGAVTGAKRKAKNANTAEIVQMTNGRWTYIDKAQQMAASDIGYTHCPSCNDAFTTDATYNVHCDDSPLIEQEYECTSCGHEFGQRISRGVGITIEPDRPTRNGVTRPSKGGKCSYVWELCDAIREETGEAPTPAVLKERCISEQPEFSVITLRVQHGKWNKFNSVS